MEKRKIGRLLLSDLIQLNYDDEIQIKSSFDNYVKELGEDESILFLLSSDGFRTLLPEIERYRKTGVEVRHPSEFIVTKDIPD